MIQRILGIDTSPFIYRLEKNPMFSGLTLRLFELVERGGMRAVTSTLSLMEVLVRPKQLSQQKVADDYGFLLRTFPNLTLRSIDDTCAEKAVDLRAAYGIRPSDALQIGTCDGVRCDLFCYE